MGQGLGRNSPVQLSLGRENYEALIERHGQWVRWRTATKCPCATKGSPDIHCRKCGGRGFTYSYQKSRSVFQTVMCADPGGILELDSAYRDCALERVYDASGREYPNAVKAGVYLILNSAESVKGEYVTAVMSEDSLKTVAEAKCEKAGAGYWRVEGLRSSRPNIEGLSHSAPGDIVRIGKIVDAAGEEWEAAELRQDKFFIEPRTDADTGEEIEPTEPLVALDVGYLPPSLFVILSQNLNRGDGETVHKAGGDAVLTFPYGCDVSNDDVITVLSGSYTQKEVVKRKRAKYDTLEAYFVDGVSRCVGETREYKEGVDFMLCGANYIKWLCEDSPGEGENYSITYRVCPTYRVVLNIPQIRTSENQRMPKKAVIKLMTTYSEKSGINRQ